MDRRLFLTKTGTCLSFLGFSPVLEAAAGNAGKNDKKSGERERAVLPFVPGSWTLVILPDTQNYSLRYPGLFRLQTQWILENKDKYNIVYVLQNGDITDRNTKLEWERASRCLGTLDAAVPYAIVPGNHDYVDRKFKNLRREATKINDYFPPSRFQDWATFGGTMEEGRIENNYHLFEAGGRKWIIIGIEWAPRDETLRWADRLLSKYADRKAIVFTHAYLYHDSSRYDWAKKGKSQNANPHSPSYSTEGSVNDGEQMWQKLIKKHENIFMVMSGHVTGDGLGFQISKGVQGNPIKEMLVNYQMLQVGGGAWLRMLEFLPDGRTVHARSYSPLYEKYDSGAENQFTFTIE